MTKKKNAGFSMVEILISIAIFAILMIPIVSAIISSLNMTTESKELQYRNDFAEHMMEHIKAVDIDDIEKQQYYLDIGTTAGSFESKKTEGEVAVEGTSPVEKLKSTKYTINGKTRLGNKGSVYTYKVEVDNSYYVNQRSKNKNFMDPNNLALGIVEDIDYRKVALIDGTILNYDATAAVSLRTKKMQKLKTDDYVGYQQMIEGKGTDIFRGDMAKRLTMIEISGEQDKGYTVKCTLYYVDLSQYMPEDDYVSYVPYAQTFKELPNIYLTYNPCYYNTDYATDDYVVVDTTGITDSEDEMPMINFFLVEISSTYSQALIDSGALGEKVDPSKQLYRSDTKNGGERDKTKIHLAASVSAVKDLNQINVYHNIGDNTIEHVDEHGKVTVEDKINVKSPMDNFYYKSDTLLPESERNKKTVVDEALKDFATRINKDLPDKKAKTFCAMQETNSEAAYVGALNSAKEENRGLYQVKIWLKKGDEAITDADQPILQGTKGGNET